MPDLTHLRKVAEAYTSGPSAAAEKTRVAFEEAFTPSIVRALMDRLEKAEAEKRMTKAQEALLIGMACVLQGMAPLDDQTHLARLIEDAIEEAEARALAALPATLSRLEKEAGR